MKLVELLLVKFGCLVSPPPPQERVVEAAILCAVDHLDRNLFA